MSGARSHRLPDGRGRSTLARLSFAVPVLLTTLGALSLLSGVFHEDGITLLEAALLLLYAILILWISASFWTAAIGFLVLLRGGRTPPSAADAAAPAPVDGAFKTALVMPVYNEDTTRIFAGLRAIHRSLQETGQAAGFEIFILSDTRDPDLWVEEEQHWHRWAMEIGPPAQVFYRNRVDNTRRKAGNLADFCRQWGGRYRYMIVLDADSLMSGATLVEMVARMERHPDVALIQVPPVPINRESLFARILQFAGSLYGRIFVTGLRYWQGDASNYWGHNAIIRVAPFAAHCGLPDLPGPKPFGGEILSHDFVEAALLCRAGWKVWLADDLGGSYEEIPPTLIDYAKRDRRWCQGNLQHARLAFAQGFKGISRVHFLMGVMSYLASPLWLLFLLLAGVQAYLDTLDTPVYFFGDHLLPIWPTSYVVEMATVLWVTLAMLFLPKLFALILLALRDDLRRAYGGLARAAASVLLESLVSVLLAPILMLFQSKFVAAILLRKDVGWPPQQRGDHQTGLSEALATHGSQVLLAIGAGLVTYFYVPAFFWWFTAVLAGLVLAVPISMATSRTRLGRLARSAGLFVTPEETAPPRVLELLRACLAEPPAPSCAASLVEQPWYRTVVVPCAYALHTSLLSEEPWDRRRQHALEGLIFKLEDHGPAGLDATEKRALLVHRDGLDALHRWLWSGPTAPATPLADTPDPAPAA